MALNQWLRSSLTVFAVALAITGLLVGSSSSQDADKKDGTPPEKKAKAAVDSKTLTITIRAADSAQVSSLTVGLAKLFDGQLDSRRLQQLERRLKDVFAIEGEPFDQVFLRVDQRLNSGDLIKVINVCDRQKTADGGQIKKISFVVLDAE